MEEKHAGGRPPKYKTAEEMQKVIDEYFESCFRIMRNKDGEGMIDPKTGEYCYEQHKPFTVSGLAYALGIDRRTLLNYSEKDEFFPTIKRAKNRIETFLEESLITGSSCTGIIFNLKNNYDWRDKQENINIETSYEDYIKKVADEDEY